METLKVWTGTTFYEFDATMMMWYEGAFDFGSIKQMQMHTDLMLTMKYCGFDAHDEYCCLMITMKYCAMNAHDEYCKAQLDHEAEEYYEAQLDHEEVLRGTTGSRRGTAEHN